MSLSRFFSGQIGLWCAGYCGERKTRVQGPSTNLACPPSKDPSQPPQFLIPSKLLLVPYM